MDNFKEVGKILAKKFIDRKLSVKELEKVNKRLETDPVFAETMAFHVAMRDAFAAEEKEHTVATKTPVVQRVNYIKFLWSVAAVFIGILTLWFLFNQYNTNAKEIIRETALTQFKDNLEVKIRLGNLLEINDLIKKENYPKALELLKEAHTNAIDKCKNDQVNYKLGILLLYQQPTDNVTEAILPLKCIYDNYKDVYPTIPIHLARAYWWSGQKENASAIIQESRVVLPSDLQELKE